LLEILAKEASLTSEHAPMPHRACLAMKERHKYLDVYPPVFSAVTVLSI